MNQATGETSMGRRVLIADADAVWLGYDRRTDCRECTGQGLGISKERVRQLPQRALDKLRALAERHHVELPGN